LIDLDAARPFPGQRVLALSIGGVLAPTIWSEAQASFYDAWMEYPKTPTTVKDKQNMRVLTAMLDADMRASGVPTLAELTERFKGWSGPEVSGQLTSQSKAVQ
jgi:hypothetical protein